MFLSALQAFLVNKLVFLDFYIWRTGFFFLTLYMMAAFSINRLVSVVCVALLLASQASPASAAPVVAENGAGAIEETYATPRAFDATHITRANGGSVVHLSLIHI